MTRQLNPISESEKSEDEFSFIGMTRSRIGSANNLIMYNDPQIKINQLRSLRTVATLNTNQTSSRSINRLNSNESNDGFLGFQTTSNKTIQRRKSYLAESLGSISEEDEEDFGYPFNEGEEIQYKKNHFKREMYI